MNDSLHLWLIPLLPFIGFVLNGLLGRRLPKSVVSAIALLAPLVSFVWVLKAALPIFFIQLEIWVQGNLIIQAELTMHKQETHLKEKF